MAELGLDVEIRGNVKPLKVALSKMLTDIDGIQKAVDESFSGLNSLASKYPGYFEDALAYAKELKVYLNELSSQKGPFTLKQQAKLEAGVSKYGSLITGAPSKVAKQEEADRKEAIRLVREQEKATIKLAREEEKRAAKAAKEAKEEHGNYVRARYALYDVANEGRRVGLIMVGLGLAAAKVGGDFEKAFKDVERTTGATGGALENMRQSLLGISQTTPISFKDVTTVATLGAQMGIAAGGVDEFASTVSKFSAVTGVAVDTAATSFGRIGELLDVSSYKYEDLASAVLYAGRNSLATEEQILTLTSQIAASASQAGYLADETVGLATALASLGIKPEEARGVILRLFADFDRVTAEGGQKLADYAAVMGITSDAAKSMWENSPAQFFNEFSASLASTAGSSENMTQKLMALGIVETREVNVLKKLAGNQDVVKKSFEDAGAAYKAGTDLADQFAMKTDNLNDKLIELGNNMLALTAAIGGGIGLFLKPMIDLFTDLVRTLTNNPIAIGIGAISTVLAAGVGIFLLYKAAIAQAMATTFAMRTTLKELSVEGINTSISIAGLRAQVALLNKDFGFMNVGAAKAAFSITGIKTAASGAVAIFTRFIPQMAAIGGLMAVTSFEANRAAKNTSAMAQEMYNIAGAGKELNNIAFLNPDKNKVSGSFLVDPIGQLSDFQIALEETAKFTNVFTDALFGMVGMGEITTLSLAKKDIAGIDVALTELVTNGKINEAKKLYDELSVQADKVGVSQKQLAEEFLPNYQDALKNSIPAVNDLADAQLEATMSGDDLADTIKTRLTESMIGGASQQAKFAEAVVDFSESLAKSKGSISAWSANGRKALSSFEALLENIAAISGNDMGTAIKITAAAIRQIELAGGDASFQVQGLVARINSMYGLNLNGSTVTSIAQLQALIASTGTIASATKVQINAMLTGGDFAGLMKQAYDAATKSINTAGNAVKKQVRTIKAYASDISGLFSDIYDRAFSLTEASDSYATGWENITQRITDAKDQIKELQTEIDDMSATKGVLTYQLGVAEKYGDTLRAAKLRAQLAKLEADLTKKTTEKTKAQEESSASLTANTQAARDNKEAIRSQVQEAGALIEAYASTAQANGKLPTKAEVASYAQTLSNKFREQATAIGFTSTEIEQYAKLIAGFGKAVKNVDLPNVKVSLDPVTTAVKAYLAEKKETKVNASLGNGNEFLTGIQSFLDASIIKAKVQAEVGYTPETKNKYEITPAGPALQSPGDFGMKPLATATQQQLLATYKKTLASAKSTLALATRAGSYNGVVSANNTITATEKKIKDLEAKYRFAAGGFVSGPGTANSDSINARLSNGEYVVQASAVNRYGVDFMNSLNQMRVGMPAAVAARGSSQSSSVVYLSPEDRALLRAAADRPIALYTENTKIAQSANAGNVVLAQRGTN